MLSGTVTSRSDETSAVVLVVSLTVEMVVVCKVPVVAASVVESVVVLMTSSACGRNYINAITLNILD